ncbi:MAG: tRNA pseudouridine(55) synthase TruB [Actinomycetia bacterium]|nr:tRNA pseudouridine(55) synthase TruB [Actinomycetes bacterium]
MARRRNDGPDGLVVIDKPAGWTSHDVVAKLRGVLGTRRVGHAGTLDPDATGVLLVGVGRVTRLLRFLTALPKTYVGEIVLGVETDTLDAAGEVTFTHDMGGVTVERARAVAAQHLTGDILQIPPMVSAIKIDGKRLHELARQGIEVEREARPVTVHDFSLHEVPGDEAVLLAGVQCSSGTYVRTLAADLGHLLGGGAHLRDLRRTAIGSFGLDEAGSIEEPALLSPAEAMRDLISLTVDAEQAIKVSHGQRLDLDSDGPGPWAVLDSEGGLLAVFERVDGRVKPAVVIRPAST